MVRSMYRNQSAGVAGKFSFSGGAQRAIRPLAGRGVLQRVIGATGADVPQLPVGDFVAHSLYRPAASRARLPDRIGHWHVVFPRYGSLTSAATAISRRLRRVAWACRRFLTPRPRVTQLEAVTASGGVMGQEFYESLAQRVRVIAEKADPFTRRRLLGLAKRYDAKGGPWGDLVQLTAAAGPGHPPPASIFSGPSGA